MNKRLSLILSGLLLAASSAFAATTELNRIAAVVNDDVVTALELKNRTDQLLRQLEKNGAELPPREVIDRQMLERLIIERIQVQLARQAGVQVEDEAVNQVLGNIARENGLDLATFRQVLERDGYDFAAFRDSIRDQILVSRLRTRHIANQVSVSPQELADYLAAQSKYSRYDQEYRLSHILIALPEGASPEQVQQARTRADEVFGKLRLGADFRQLALSYSDGQQALEGGDLGWRRGGELPALFADAAMKAKEGDVLAPIRTPSGFHILQLTGVRGEQEKSVVQQTRARHILIAPSAILSDGEARARAERLRERLLAGDDFAALARAHSDDKGSGSNGGDLGWASPGQMVPEFEKAMNETPVGQISEPIRSQFGWHIVQPLERREHDNTEELRRSRAGETLRQRKIEEETEKWLRQIRDEAYVEVRQGG